MSRGSGDAHAGLSDMGRGRRLEAEGRIWNSDIREVCQREGERRAPRGSEHANAGMPDMWRERMSEAEMRTPRSGSRYVVKGRTGCKVGLAGVGSRGYPRQADFVGMTGVGDLRDPRIQDLRHDIAGMPCIGRAEDRELAWGRSHDSCLMIAGMDVNDDADDAGFGALAGDSDHVEPSVWTWIPSSWPRRVS